MNRAEIIERLREAETALRARGVLHMALFGSRATGTPRSDSDIDTLVDLEADTVADIYAYVGLRSFVGDLFPGQVDVVARAALKPHIRPTAEIDVVYAF